MVKITGGPEPWFARVLQRIERDEDCVFYKARCGIIAKVHGGSRNKRGATTIWYGAREIDPDIILQRPTEVAKAEARP